MKTLHRAALIALIFSGNSASLFPQSFTRVDEAAGLHVNYFNNGAAVADYDGDGDLDIFFTGYFNFIPEDEKTWNRLMRNDGDDGTGIRFTDVTIEAGFSDQFVNTVITNALGDKMGASWGDYDNDGWPDLFLSNRRLDQLYHNNGDGTFTDVTETAGVAGCFDCYSSGGLWFDHNRDGFLDLYVSNLKGENILYENLGDGTFRDITEMVNAAGDAITWSTIAIDVGRDGFLDLYAANDTQNNEFFENRSGLSYNEASLAYRLGHLGAGMGQAVGDYNNDGLFDIYVTNIFNHLPNPLFENLGNRRFRDVAEEMGVDNAAWGWGTHFFDCDHDGDEDLAAVTGVVEKQSIDGMIQQDEPHFFFKNMLVEIGHAGFIDWSVESGTNGDARARGLEVFDMDHDGDLDMVVANPSSTPYLYRNDEIGFDREASGRNWLQIKLEGTVSNRNAFGTELKITAGEQSYYRWHQGQSFFAQSIKPVHVGVGPAETIDEIQIRWISGMIETYQDIGVNQVIEIIEGQGITTSTKDEQVIQEITKPIVSPNPFSHETSWTFDLGEPGEVVLRVFSVTGQEVYRTEQRFSEGRVKLDWNGRIRGNGKLNNGLYYYTLSKDAYQVSGKLAKQ